MTATLANENASQAAPLAARAPSRGAARVDWLRRVGTAQNGWSRAMEIAPRRRHLAYDPWEDIEAFAEWEVSVTGRLPDGYLGLCGFGARKIWIKAGQPEWQMRSTLTHELLHAERGPVPAGQQKAEERAVELLTAKRLVDPVVYDALPAGGVGRAIAGTALSTSDLAACRLLGVDKTTLRVYAGWRRRVTASGAVRVWDRHRMMGDERRRGGLGRHERP